MENGFQNVSYSTHDFYTVELCLVFTKRMILEIHVRLLKNTCVFTVCTISGNFFWYFYLLY